MQLQDCPLVSLVRNLCSIDGIPCLTRVALRRACLLALLTPQASAESLSAQSIVACKSRMGGHPERGRLRGSRGISLFACFQHSVRFGPRQDPGRYRAKTSRRHSILHDRHNDQAAESHKPRGCCTCRRSQHAQDQTDISVQIS